MGLLGRSGGGVAVGSVVAGAVVVVDAGGAGAAGVAVEVGGGVSAGVVVVGGVGVVVSSGGASGVADWLAGTASATRTRELSRPALAGMVSKYRPARRTSARRVSLTPGR